MQNLNKNIDMYLTKTIKSGGENYTHLEIQLLYSKYNNKKEFTIKIFNRLVGETTLHTNEIHIDPVNLINYPNYLEDPGMKWIKGKMFKIYYNQAFPESYSEYESNNITIELLNNLVAIIKGNEENHLEKLEDKKLLKKINDNIKKAQKSNNQNKITSENRTHLRKLEYLQMQTLKEIIKKYDNDTEFLTNLIKWLYDQKFERKNIYTLLEDMNKDKENIHHIINTVYENNKDYIGEDKIRKKIDLEKDYDTLFDIINLSELYTTRITHSISDNTSIISNPETFKVEKELITEHRGNVSYFTSTIIEAIPIEIIKYDNRILQESISFKIKWKSKNEVFSTPPYEEGFNTKEIKEELINRGSIINSNDAIPAISSLINAFENRKLIKIKRDIQKPGFYFDKENNKINVIKYEIKDYKKGLYDAIQVLESLKDYFKDNIDKLATILKWGWISPFFYAMKQKGNESVCYLCLSGVADAGKTSIGEIVLYLWDKPKDGDNEISGAKAGSVARLGSIVNSGTFPILINETAGMFIQLEMIELIKTSVYGLIARAKYKGNTLKSYAALTPFIFTENGYLPEDAGAIRRIHEIVFSLSEIKTEKEKMEYQKRFKTNHKDKCELNKLKSISYFIANEIIHDPNLLDMDYNDLAITLLRRLYSDIGYTFPNWLNQSVEIYSMDDMYDIQEETIRSFLVNTINNAHIERISDATYNSDGLDKFLNLDRNEGIDLRVDTILSRQLVPWIIAKKNRNGDIMVCLTIEFAKQLKEKTGINHQLKTLGQLIGFNYGNQYFGKSSKNKSYQKKVIWTKLEDFKMFLFPETEID